MSDKMLVCDDCGGPTVGNESPRQFGTDVPHLWELRGKAGEVLETRTLCRTCYQRRVNK